MSTSIRDERLALGGLGAIILVTAAWWALALWPVQAAPEWLARTRLVCFGAAPGGLPDGGGWILLIGQPLGMLGFLLIVWGGLLRRSLQRLMSGLPGMMVVGSAALAIVVGFTAAGVRVASVAVESTYDPVGPDASTYPRLDRVAPQLRLRDQRGREFDLDSVRGRPVLLTFAYAHCETICPVVVQQALAARDHRAGETVTRPDRRTADAVVVVVTLDPWRDTPPRLPSIARQWGLGEGDFVLSGGIPAVLSVLESWNVLITRDESTGLIEHSALVYVIGPDGRIAFAATGGTGVIADLLALI